MIEAFMPLSTQFWLAYDLVTRLPQVHATMDAGVLGVDR